MKDQDKKPLIVPQERHELTPQGKKYTTLVMVNVRECGLDYMFHKHLIVDYQHKAGIKFRQIFESSAIGGMKGRDLSLFITGGAKDKVSYGALHNIQELVFYFDGFFFFHWALLRIIRITAATPHKVRKGTTILKNSKNFLADVILS